MSKAKFTKGEWRASTCSAGGLNTALVYLGSEGGFDLSGAPDCIPNAHLIAAVPDMLILLSLTNQTCTTNGETNEIPNKRNTRNTGELDRTSRAKASNNSIYA